MSTNSSNMKDMAQSTVNCGSNSSNMDDTAQSTVNCGSGDAIVISENNSNSDLAAATLLQAVATQQETATAQAEATQQETATAQAEATQQETATAQAEANQREVATAQTEATQREAATAQTEATQREAATAQAEATQQETATAQTVANQRVAIVILNWNGQEFLERFLAGVIEHSSHAARIIVTDNGSTDNSVEWLNRNFPQIELIELDKNYGFTGGYNRALEQVEAEYYLLLNSDIEVTPGWLEPLVKLMDTDPGIAAAQPKVRSYAYNHYFEYAGAAGGYIDTLGYPFCRGRLIGACEMDKGQYDDTREIFWATGAAFMVRAELYHKFGGLDENFFAHQEEIDLCWRFKRGGYKIMACPESVIYHVGAGTLPVWSPFKTYLNFRNNIAMLYKNLSKRRFAVVYLIRMGTDLLRLVSYAACLKMDFAAAIYRGHRDFWRMRKKLNRHKEHGFGKVGSIYKGSIVLYHVLISDKFDKLSRKLKGIGT